MDGRITMGAYFKLNLYCDYSVLKAIQATNLMNNKVLFKRKADV